MIDPFRLLGANLRVAANMAYADENERERLRVHNAWVALIARAAAVGAKLQRCHLDPDCDGECGCGPGLVDQDGHYVSGGETHNEDLAMFTRLVEQLESGVGLNQ